MKNGDARAVSDAVMVTIRRIETMPGLARRPRGSLPGQAPRDPRTADRAPAAAAAAIAPACREGAGPLGGRPYQ
jgi:hypothetical protein